MSINDDLLNEIDDLFGDKGDKTATVNLNGNSDPEMAEMLEIADKEIKQLEGAAEKEPSKKDSEGASQLGLFPENAGKNECSAKKISKGKKATSCSSTPPKPKEPEKDLERFVVLTSYNEQKVFPAEMTLEEIRVELEKEYPAYSKENTSWYFEKQDSRYLCIPNYKSNKAG